MSDTVIQTTAPDELQGGQAPLAPDSKKSTHGFDSADQNSLSFCRGQNVEAGSGNNGRAVSPNNANGAASRESASVSGMCVSGRQQESAKLVDRRTIEGSGSYAGDTRAKGSPAVLPANPGPREPMTQARLTNKLDTPPAQSFSSDLDSDVGN